MIVELGFKLDNDLIYYDKLLKENGLNNCFNCITHDIYYTNKKLDGLTESEMKNSCIRIRISDSNKYRIENTSKFDIIKNISFKNNINEIESQLTELGFTKVFDTLKKDHHYTKNKMQSRVQLQEIKNIGLLVYYDNPLYYNLPLDIQRKKLIDDLNSFGFKFKYNNLGLDKLRTLYYKKEMYSKNQSDIKK